MKLLFKILKKCNQNLAAKYAKRKILKENYNAYCYKFSDGIINTIDFVIVRPKLTGDRIIKSYIEIHGTLFTPLSEWEKSEKLAWISALNIYTWRKSEWGNFLKKLR